MQRVRGAKEKNFYQSNISPFSPFTELLSHDLLQPFSKSLCPKHTKPQFKTHLYSYLHKIICHLICEEELVQQNHVGGNLKRKRSLLWSVKNCGAWFQKWVSPQNMKLYSGNKHLCSLDPKSVLVKWIVSQLIHLESGAHCTPFWWTLTNLALSAKNQHGHFMDSPLCGQE